jgi:hypothetical protein
VYIAGQEAKQQIQYHGQGLQQQGMTSAPQMEHFAVNCRDPAQRAEARACLQTSLEANPVALPMKAQIYTSASDG